MNIKNCLVINITPCSGENVNPWRSVFRRGKGDRCQEYSRKDSGTDVVQNYFFIKEKFFIYLLRVESGNEIH